MLLSYKMVQSSLYVLVNAIQLMYCDTMYVLRLCALQFLVQFMCTAVIGAVYVHCINLCSLWVLYNFYAIYGYCIM